VGAEGLTREHEPPLDAIQEGRPDPGQDAHQPLGQSRPLQQLIAGERALDPPEAAGSVRGPWRRSLAPPSPGGLQSAAHADTGTLPARGSTPIPCCSSAASLPSDQLATIRFFRAMTAPQSRPTPSVPLSPNSAARGSPGELDGAEQHFLRDSACAETDAGEPVLFRDGRSGAPPHSGPRGEADCSSGSDHEEVIVHGRPLFRLDGNGSGPAEGGACYDNLILMESHISATRAARTFSDLLSRVRYRGETFVIERGGEPVGRLVPATPALCTLAQLARLLRELPPPDPGYWETLESITTNQPALPKSPWRR
jgi:antitoxin (DNA-binding transcriptional repressor) of toxin-antitoxin stability system